MHCKSHNTYATFYKRLKYFSNLSMDWKTQREIWQLFQKNKFSRKFLQKKCRSHSHIVYKTSMFVVGVQDIECKKYTDITLKLHQQGENLISHPMV